MRRARVGLAPTISLFPFLAVLLCTMGALILLLVIITRQNRLQAATLAAEQSVELKEQAAIEEEDLSWRITQLKEAHSRTETELAHKRNQLASVEEHLLRLNDQATKLADIVARLTVGGPRPQAAAAEAELARLHNEIIVARESLEKARQDAGQHGTSYSVVPYAGPNGTTRRPLYIECLRDKVVLQPEGVVFSESDFEGEIGPGNPLAAAVRAARDHIVSHAPADAASAGDPYPLLLVRPDGIPAYNAARVAITSWGSDFGYEFIDADWKLAYGPADAELADIERRAAEAARARIVRRGPAASGLYARRSRAIYRASPTRGGLIREGGSNVEGAFGASEGGGGRWGGSEEQSESSSGSTGEQGANASSDAASAAAERSPSSPAQSTATDRSNAVPPQQVSKLTGESQPGGDARSESLAKKRGRDWSLPPDAMRAVPLRRPIRVQCRDDQLIVLPDKGATGGHSIAIGANMEKSVDELVRAVWSHTKGWGIAGSGMYWRPELVLEIGPGGEVRFAELQHLLKDSGLEIRRSK